MCKVLLILLLSMPGLAAVAQKYRVKDYSSAQEKLNNEYCTGSFKSARGVIIDLTNENESVHTYLNILNWLEGRVAGLQIRHLRDGTPVPYLRDTRATIFVDEMQVEPAFLNDLPVTDIAMVKIIKGPFVGAPGNGGGGTVLIYTLKGDDDDNPEPDN